MRPMTRRTEIVRIVEAEGQATVEDLARLLDASRETIRRDLALMDREGLIRKYHGGARVRDGAALPEPVGEDRFAARMAENIRGKRAIGKYAAGLFREGDVLFIDTGTTTVIFAEFLARLRGLKIITNSLKIAEIMGAANAGHQVFMVGGDYDPDASETLGALALQQIGHMHADHVVLTVGGIHEEGIRDFDLREAEIARAMISNARRVTVLADSSKFQRAGIFDVAPMSRIDRIVTDVAPSPGMMKAFEEGQTSVIVAENNPHK